MSDPYGYDGSSVNPDAFADRQKADRSFAAAQEIVGKFGFAASHVDQENFQWKIAAIIRKHIDSPPAQPAISAQPVYCRCTGIESHLRGPEGCRHAAQPSGEPQDDFPVIGKPKYWQCPNDESHTLRTGEYIYGTQHRRMYCTVCPDAVAVFRSKPAEPPARVEQRQEPLAQELADYIPTLRTNAMQGDTALDFATIQARAKGISEWLKKNGRECFDEQKHLDQSTQERIYWHYGYLVALRDVYRYLTGESLTSETCNSQASLQDRGKRG